MATFRTNGECVCDLVLGTMGNGCFSTGAAMAFGSGAIGTDGADISESKGALFTATLTAFAPTRGRYVSALGISNMALGFGSNSGPIFATAIPRNTPCCVSRRN